MKKWNSQQSKRVSITRYEILKNQLEIPISVLESRLKSSAKLLQDVINELDGGTNDVFKNEHGVFFSIAQIREVEYKVRVLLKNKSKPLPKNESGKNQKNFSHCANIEEILLDFKNNASILHIKKKLEASGIDVKRL